MTNIKQVPVADLIPYVNNARTHSDAQVAQIAASIKEFSFTNPILTDGENGIIAGHGRLMAAKKLGLKEVPVIELSSLTKSAIKNGMKDCLCIDCGTEFSARKDTSPKSCKRCAASRGGKAAKGKIRALRKKCKGCENLIVASKKDKYCSIDCRSKSKKETRSCKTCNKEFKVLKSSIANNTNASGNFCSRPCYEKWLCNSERKTGRGSQWRKIRLIAKSLQPFCAICGTKENLQVHHIAPFRLSFDNSQDNLIPLCTKHHKVVESITHDIELTGSHPDDIKLIMGNILRSNAQVQRLSA